MNEDRKTIYCTQCGNENPEGAKFCSNCGAKLEMPALRQTEGVFSGNETPVYEKITDAEEEKPASIPYQEEIQIHYEPEKADSYGANEYGGGYHDGTGANGYDKNTYGAGSYNKNTYDTGAYGDAYNTNGYYDNGQAQYYSGEAEKTTGGNIGFAIASLVCGILSLLCCCLDLFSPILAIAAIVLGVITLCFKYDGKGMAIAGIATGGVALVFRLIIVVITLASGTTLYEEFMHEFMDEFH
ncbi:MAG: zinc-ribbon domain-containing protein [Clostridium sp.]|nr:zinc-ribbon domain-containing protein [Clostridium sp.]